MSAQNNTSEFYKEKTRQILNEFKETDFKSEIIPIDAQNAEMILRDPTFWVVFSLGVLPLMITSLQDGEMQLTGLLFFFALLWGGIFRGFVLKSTDHLILPVFAFFFTGLIGISLLRIVFSCFPAFYLNLPDSPHVILRLFGSIFQTGLWEELCKIIPVVLYLLYKRTKCNPTMLLLIGVFSGLGFAAFENILYSTSSITGTIEKSISGAQNGGGEGLVMGIAAGVHGAMVNVLLRSMSLVFAHALWTAIFSYYLALAFLTGKRWFVLCLLGLFIPAVLHGSYNWFCGLQPVFAAAIIAISFILFFGYLSKIRTYLNPPTCLANNE
ncbi:MAG: PrsW family intramembrane metalloprotease [Thermoguttaceae bacterium]